MATISFQICINGNMESFFFEKSKCSVGLVTEEIYNSEKNKYYVPVCIHCRSNISHIPNVDCNRTESRGYEYIGSIGRAVREQWSTWT